MMCYGSNMTQRREAREALPKTSQETAGRREAAAFARSLGDVPVRDLLVAGGLLGFTPAEMFEGAA